MSCFCGVLAGNKNKKDEIKKYCLDTASKSIFGSSQAGNNPEYFATFCQQNTCVTFDKYSKNGGRILPVK